MPDSSFALEECRLAALDRYKIMDTVPEQEYDDLVALAAAICGTPIATLTFVNRDHQWHKASVGMPRLRTARETSFCTHTIAQTKMMVIADTAVDPRFADNPLVSGDPHMRFYAGMPLVTADRYALGTICVVDTQPRELTPMQTHALEVLSRQAISLLELRLSADRMEHHLAESLLTQAALRESGARLRQSESKLQFACRAGHIGLWEMDLRTRSSAWSETQAGLFGLRLDEFDGTWEQMLSCLHPDDRDQVYDACLHAGDTLTPLNLEVRVVHPDETIHWLTIRGEVLLDPQGRPLHMTGSTIDITERKQAEEALRRSEERLRGIITAAPLILSALDAEGIITASEGKGLELIGLRPGQIVGCPVFEMFGEQPKAQEQIERVYGGEVFNEPTPLGEMMFENWFSPIFGEDGHVSSVIIVSYDITEQCKAKDALRSSEARFQAFMDNSPASAYVRDTAGRFVYVNDAFQRMAGFSERDCLGKTAMEIFPDELGATIHQETQNTLISDQLTQSFFQLPNPAGGTMDWLSYRFTFWDSERRQFLGSLGFDVTEQRQAERQREEAQHTLEATLSQLNATLEATADGLLVVDTQGQILCANGNFYEMWHITGEMRQNRDDSKQLAYVSEQLIDPAAFRARVVYLYSHPDETTFDVLNLKDGRIFERYSRPLLIQGDSAGRVWSFRDVTEQEQTRQDLVRVKNDALASAQAKSEFLANMSHEIRTPMNGILGMTDLLLATPMLPQQKHQAMTIKNSADSLLTVINDILDFSKIEAGKMTLESVPFSITQVMQEVKDLLEPRAKEKNLPLLCTLPLNFPPVLCGDPARLRQILTNLVGNALKFTERGQVVLEARVLRETATHAEMRLSVRDTGIGIPEHRRAAIFESFTQVDGSISRRYGGTGLGLAICLRLTDLMAGRIGLESELGQGSEFWIVVTLEKATAVLEATLATPWPTEADPLGLRVLLAEDNLINQEVACGFLEMWGCTVDAVGDGWQACLAIRDKTYDLVLMDIQMPQMDGRQATAEIRGRERGTTQHLPIIAMTAHNMQGDREQCLAYGMDDYVSKPVDPEQLLTALRKWGHCSPASAETVSDLPLTAPVISTVTPHEAAPTRLPVLDVERLHRSCAGKATLERRIMEETRRLSPQIVARLRSAVDAADAELCRFEAHTLKGSSRTLGAEALGTAAATLEDAAKTGILTDAPTLLEQIEAEWSALDALLQDCLTCAPWKETL